MTELTKALSNLRDAALELTGELGRLDQRIADLHSERDAITSAPVTRDDFLDYVRADIIKRSTRFAVELKRNIGTINKSFSVMERIACNDEYSLPIRYLSPLGVPVDATEGALCLYLEDAIIAGVSRVIDTSPWPENAISAAGRNDKVALIDVEIEKLTVQRDGLAQQLIDAGLAG